MIKRHNFNSNVLNTNFSFFNSGMDYLKEDLTHNPDIVGTIFKDSILAIGDAITGLNNPQDINKLIQISNDLGINIFRNAQNIGTINYQLLQESFEVKGSKNNAYSDPITWSKCFYIAVLARDKKAIDELVRVPEEILRNAKLKCDEVDFAVVNFLKSLYQPKADLGAELLKALDLTDPEKNKAHRIDFLLYLRFPELSLYRYIFGNDNEKFNMELKETLELHKKFWSTKSNMNSSEGWISIPLLCACIIAYESNNYTTNIESDYLPKYLIE